MSRLSIILLVAVMMTALLNIGCSDEKPTTMNNEVDRLHEEIDALRHDVYDLHEEIYALRHDVYDLRQDIDSLHKDIKFLIEIIVDHTDDRPNVPSYGQRIEVDLNDYPKLRPDRGVPSYGQRIDPPSVPSYGQRIKVDLYTTHNDHPELRPGEFWLENSDYNGYNIFCKTKRVGNIAYDSYGRILTGDDRPVFVQSHEAKNVRYYATDNATVGVDYDRPWGTFVKLADGSRVYIVSKDDDNGLWGISSGSIASWLNLIECNPQLVDINLIMPGDTLYLTLPSTR